MLHFSGHGENAQLCFEDSKGNSKLISPDALVRIFRQAGQYTTCLVLNACGSAGLASRLAEFIPHVIGFPDRIEDEYAEVFSKTFYETLSLGHIVRSSYEMAVGTIETDVEPKRLPILYENENLPNYSKSIFRQPILTAEFVVNGEGVKKDGSMYNFRCNIRNLPVNTSYILYEFVDESFTKDYRFHLVEDLKSGSYCEEFSYGDVVIHAWLWFSDKKYGIGIESSLSEALKTFYDNNLPQKCRKAYDQICNS